MTNVKQFEKNRRCEAEKTGGKHLENGTLSPRFLCEKATALAQPLYQHSIAITSGQYITLFVLWLFVQQNRRTQVDVVYWDFSNAWNASLLLAWFTSLGFFWWSQCIQEKSVYWIHSWQDNPEKCVLMASQNGQGGKSQRTGHVYKYNKKYSVSLPLPSLWFINLHYLVKKNTPSAGLN